MLSFKTICKAFVQLENGVNVIENGNITGLSLEAVLEHWLWHCDPNEECEGFLLELNLMQITGILFARILRQNGDGPEIADLVDDVNELRGHGVFIPHIIDVDTGATATVENFTIKKTTDALSALQNQWTKIEAVAPDMLDQLTTFLLLVVESFISSKDIPENIADDVTLVEEVEKKRVLTHGAIKSFLSVFFVLYRVLYLSQNATQVPPVQGTYPFEIESFHLEAATDDFHMLGMFYAVPPGSLLEYKSTFHGFFNNISQVVFRHFPDYKRAKQPELASVLSRDAPDLFVLPSLKQLYPDITYAYEDAAFSHSPRAQRDTDSFSASAAWVWLVLGGQIYLICLENGVAYTAPSVRDLVAKVYLPKRIF
jgi:hypothetical protein